MKTAVKFQVFIDKSYRGLHTPESLFNYLKPSTDCAALSVSLQQWIDDVVEGLSPITIEVVLRGPELPVVGVKMVVTAWNVGVLEGKE